MLGKLIRLFTGAKQPENEADQQIIKDPSTSSRALLREFGLYKPVIAAINGHAIAGGLDFLYSTDIRISCPEAKFGLQEVKWAIFPMGGMTLEEGLAKELEIAMPVFATKDAQEGSPAFKEKRRPNYTGEQLYRKQ